MLLRKIRRAVSYLLHDRSKFCDSLVANLLFWLPDEQYLKLRFRFKMGYWPNLKEPKTFVEKINWLKLHDRNPEYTKMVDKYQVKEYVAQKIGQEYIIPTLGVWKRPEDINFNVLPNQFVLKTTHGGGSGGVVVCKDKKTFDKKKAINKLRDSLASDIYRNLREWPYKNVKKQIIAEKYMMPSDKADDPTYDLTDYKFYCFNGEPHYCQVIRDRNTKETIDFYDMEWNHMPFVGLNPVAKNGVEPVAKPVHLEQMKVICRRLSKDIKFSRIDLYVIDDKEYFGEITFYPAAGFGEFTPADWNERLGELIKLDGHMGGKIHILNNDIIKEESFEELKDYKFFCFNGKVKCFKIDFGRFVEHHANYYSPEGKLLPFGEKGLEPDPNHKEVMPDNLTDMIKVAEELSKGFKFLRVDLYNVKDKIYFGELTFYPAAGMGAFVPEEWDEKLGNWIKLY